MGRHVTTVGSSTVVLIEDTPDVIQQSVLGSIHKGSNIADDLVYTITNTYAQKVKRAYQYASKDYVYGLPEGTLGRIAVNEDILREVMDTFVVLPEGGSYTIVSALIEPMVLERFAAESFSHNPNYGYDFHNQLVKNVPFYTSSGSEFRVDSPILATSFREPNIITCHFIYENPNTGVQFSNILNIEVWPTPYNKIFLNSDEYYYYVAYEVLDKDGNIQGLPKLWNYWENSNYYPKLNLDDSILDVNYYMPVIPIRIANNMLYDTDQEKESKAYKTSKRLLDILDMNIDEVTTAVKENPDIDAVDHAYIILGVNVFSNKPEALKYLFEFMEYLHATSGGQGNQIHIKDVTYDTCLKWRKTLFNSYKGSIGKVGTITRAIKLNVDTDTSDTTDYLSVKRQITDTVVHEYQVYDLVFFNYIYQTSMQVRTALDASGDAQQALCVPLNISIIETKLSPLEANTVYYDSLRIVFNSFEIKKLKWYETGFFSFFTAVISIALAPFTGGFSLIGLAISIGLSIILPAIMKFVIKVFGNKLGTFINISIAVFAIAVGIVTGGLPDVLSIVNAAISVTSSVISTYLGSEFDIVTQDYQDFKKQADQKSAELEEANKLLDQQYQIDPLGIFSAIDMNPSQTIDQYYYSKLGLPLEYGQATVDIIDHWTDLQLALPEL